MVAKIKITILIEVENMEVYFKNDGSYVIHSIKTPVIVNGKPIGFICMVTEEMVTCYLWDKYIYKEQIGVSMYGTQDIRSIGINN